MSGVDSVAPWLNTPLSMVATESKSSAVLFGDLFGGTGKDRVRPP
jgi:hypothetical protein